MKAVVTGRGKEKKKKKQKKLKDILPNNLI